MSNPAQLSQLRIADRIHFVLKHALGEGIDVYAMLNDPQEAREVLFVCQASGNAELVSLSRQFVNAAKLAQPNPIKADTPQETPWAGNTSGFSVSQPPDAPEGDESSWRNATQWLRRRSTRGV